MYTTFRWFGKEDPVKLEEIYQIPRMRGIVTALHDVNVGEVWPREHIKELKETIEDAGLELSVIESVPVHEDIKLGRDTRDQLIENYAESIRNLGAEGIKTVCYNFMPVFGWIRSDVDYELEDKSTTLIFDEEIVNKMDPVNDDLSLPGWAFSSYSKAELTDLFEAYSKTNTEDIWNNLEYFLSKIIPVAEQAGVRMAIHPDDPPHSVFNLPRIITDIDSIKRLLDLYDSESNGITACVGSYASGSQNNAVEILHYALERNRVNFVHARNVKLTGVGKSFEETAHPSEYGDIDMYEIIKALSDSDWDGPLRPDHGRMIWGETGRPGYGLYDRALGAMYFSGLWEAVRKNAGKEYLQ